MGAKASKETGNPFAGLNLKEFPAERSQRAPNRPSSRRPPVQSRKSVAPDADADPDAELFLQAVGVVRPLNEVASPRQPERDFPGDVDDSFPDKDAAPGEVPPPAGETVRVGAPPDTPRNDKLARELARNLARHVEVPAPTTVATDKRRAVPSRPEKPEPRADLLAAVGLSDKDAETDAFHRAVAGVAPLPGKGRAVVPEPEPQPAPAFEPSNPLQDLVDGKVEFALSGTDEFMEGHVVGLDLLTVGKLQARQYSPETHIDLHGLNSEQAFQHLVAFFRNAYYKGARTALVVTGRGLNSPNGVPVLRFKVQQWLTQEPFRRVVLAFCTAKREDGGPGALYVLLRKHRKNSGKVRWDAVPTDPDLFL